MAQHRGALGVFKGVGYLLSCARSLSVGLDVRPEGVNFHPTSCGEQALSCFSQKIPLFLLCENILDHIAVDVGESKITTLMSKCQLFVIDPQAMQ